ncbi:MAG: spermidine synthase [Betaproteobacteria bacterium]|nr:spermidine synthase [Betaproteobacteria bacterium]
MGRIPATIFFILFTLSGFSGLIYESIWSHYLKLFLGHAAYAQTLVLGLFMGGMAVGAWLVGRTSTRIKHALLGYTVVEFLIGLLALVFHASFTTVTAWAFDSLIPQLGSPVAITLAKWVIASLLILPASILLGATFPLMSAGIIRLYGDSEGKALPMLYFTNSLGAAVGVLVGGFVLIQQFGLPGTIFTAGLINIVLALLVWAAWKWVGSGEVTTTVDQPAVAASAYMASMLMPPTLKRVVYAVALGTGVASFMFEIAWIRMLSLAIGASTHSFEVMLSAFILGIALGGFVLSRQIGSIRNEGLWLANVLVVKCLLALLAVAIYPQLLDTVAWLSQAIGTTPNGYVLHLMASYALSGAMMLPTAICAGMTLPLATRWLLRQGEGEAAIGRVYAVNTLGAIIGTFVATHIGMQLLGVKGITGVGAAIEVLLALALLLSLKGQSRRRLLWPVLPILLAFPLYIWGLTLNPYKMASGVFRYGQFMSAENSAVPFYQDGKTATVAVTDTINDKRQVRVIRTNGKPDAGIEMKDRTQPASDETTMAMLAIAPFMYKPDAKRIANIGFGSGMTTHLVLGNPAVERVDTIEIEPAMVEGARLFSPRNDRAFNDARSQIYIEDAKTFFASQQRKYDLIISEPSNPWVSGVANLFSEEFYAQIPRYLEDDGLLVQWTHLYETKPYIVASILKALGSQFSDYVTYAAGPNDIVIIAKKKGRLPKATGNPLLVPAWRDILGELGLKSETELRQMRLGSRRLYETYIQGLPVAANSDYFPVVDLNAARERFLRSNARQMALFPSLFIPLRDVLEPTERPDITEVIAIKSNLAAPLPQHMKEIKDAVALYRTTLNRSLAEIADRAGDMRSVMAMVLNYGSQQCTTDYRGIWLEGIEYLLKKTSPYLSPQELSVLVTNVKKFPCYATLDGVLRMRMDLLEAIALRDMPGMETTGLKLMTEAESSLAPVDFELAIQAVLVAELNAAKNSEASALVEKYRVRLIRQNMPFETEMLLSMIAYRRQTR